MFQIREYGMWYERCKQKQLYVYTLSHKNTGKGGGMLSFQCNIYTHPSARVVTRVCCWFLHVTYTRRPACVGSGTCLRFLKDYWFMFVKLESCEVIVVCFSLAFAMCLPCLLPAVWTQYFLCDGKAHPPNFMCMCHALCMLC